MVHSGWGIFLPSRHFLPYAVAQNVDFPYIPHRLRASVSAVNDDVRFEVCHNVTVPCAGWAPLAIFNCPVGLVCECQEIQLVEVVVRKLSSSQRSSKNEEEMVDGERAMGGSVGGRRAMTFQLFPLSEGVIAEEGIASDDVFAWVGKGIPVSPTAPPKRRALSLLIGVIVCPKRAWGLSPVNSTLYIVIICKIIMDLTSWDHLNFINSINKMTSTCKNPHKV